MEDLTFQVKIEGVSNDNAPMIDLGMPGMDMGKNQVQMKLSDDATYKGTGVIVRCPSGKTIWRATVNIPGIGQADFIFDVIY